MESFNKLILIGNLTRDPALTYLPNQTPVVDFGLAMNRKWKGKDGQKKEKVCFVDCRAFGKSAENITKYFKKGDSILLEGELDFDTWTAQDGSKKSKHRANVSGWSFMGGKTKEETSPAHDEEPNDNSDIPF